MTTPVTPEQGLRLASDLTAKMEEMRKALDFVGSGNCELDDETIDIITIAQATILYWSLATGLKHRLIDLDASG